MPRDRPDKKAQAPDGWTDFRNYPVPGPTAPGNYGNPQYGPTPSPSPYPTPNPSPAPRPPAHGFGVMPGYAPAGYVPPRRPPNPYAGMTLGTLAGLGG